MRIESVELLRVDLPLREPFLTAAGSLDRRPLVLVRVLTDAGEGLGECPALAEPTYTEEYADGAEAVLAAHLVPRLLGSSGAEPTAAAESPDGEVTVWSLAARLEGLRGHPMAKFAIETALLDAALRSEGRSLAGWLGVEGRRVPAGAAIGMRRDPAEAVEAALAAHRAGYRRLKLKIAPGRDVAHAGAVRAALPQVHLVVDANGSYRRSDSSHDRLLSGLDELGLQGIEQPFGPDDLAGNVLRAEDLATPVLLDESIGGGAALEAALALGFRGAVSLKPARFGSLLSAGAVLERCRQSGLRASIGGLLESGIGRRVALAFGALDGFELPGELCPTGRYLAEDLVEQLQLEGGALTVPDVPGAAPLPAPDALAEWTVRRRTWRAE